MCHSLQNFILKEMTGKEGQILHGITPMDSKNHLIEMVEQWLPESSSGEGLLVKRTTGAYTMTTS